MEIMLRNPAPGDVGWLISMHGKLYGEQFEFDTEFELDIARKVLLFYENSHDFNWMKIAVKGQQRIGSIAVSLKPNLTAFVNFLLVLPNYRGLGLGEKLLREAIVHARQNNLGAVGLETYSCLKDARRLYKKAGFSIVKKNLNISKYGQTFDQEFWEKTL